MNSGITTILAVVTTSFISPMVLSFFTNRARRADKRMDWQREDKREGEQIERANQVAQSLLDSNKQIAKKAAESHLETNQKLEVIRVDVNSNMTAAMKAELDATEGQLALLREVVELKKERGIKPTPEALSYISAKEVRINELKATLKDRLTHSESAAAAAAAAAAG